MGNLDKLRAYQLRLKRDEEQFYTLNENIIADLVDECKKYQGEYRGADHGSGSWATTYSYEFIKASAELYRLFDESNIGIASHMLSECFIGAGIVSCRRAKMSIDRVEYLYSTHIKKAGEISTKLGGNSVDKGKKDRL
ncbi:MAG: hypothetical protein RPR91_04185 [Colwellia sp.]|jgi:hypothetical protein